MKALIAGAATAVAYLAALVLFVIPWVFTTVSSLFSNSDVGAAIGILVLLLISGGLITVGVLLVALISAFASTYD